MNVKQTRGKAGEDYTADKLAEIGFNILGRNFRRRGGELDIIAQEDSELVFVEVKTRKFGSLTEGADAVDRTKKRRIIMTALDYAQEHDLLRNQMRFDVAEVTVTTEERPRVLGWNYYRDAFDASGLGVW